MCKKLAVIGASYLQMPLVLKAKEMGLEVHCFAWEDGAVCRNVVDFFYPISIVNKESIYSKCKEIGVNGITTIASDTAVVTVNFVAERMGLISNPDKYTEITTNKYKMRQCFIENSIPSPKFALADTSSNFDISGFLFPLIVKPTDRSGSRGVEKIDNPKQLKPSVLRACKESFEGEAIIEEFVTGREISVETISYRGKHYILQITDKVTTGAPFFVELEHHQPSSLSKKIQQEVKRIVINALDALHVGYGASHSELKITDDGDIRVIEIGARMGGDFIGSDLVMLSTGYDFLKGVINVALGEFEEPIINEHHYSGVYFLSKETKWLMSVIKNKNMFPEIVKAEITDSKLRSIECSGDRSGYAIYHGNKKMNLRKKVLILGGGQAQLGLIQTAKKMGLYTIVVGINGNYPGYAIADKVFYADIFDKESVLDVARLEDIDGVAMVCSDFGLQTLGYVCDKLNLKGLSERAAINSSNKLKMKRLLLEAGVNTARFAVLKTEEDVDNALRDLSFPLIVKAVDLQGSRGIYICRSREELILNYRKSISDSRVDYCLVEEFIEGDEFGAQAFIYQGETFFVQSHGDIVLKSGTTNIPIGHYMPLFNCSSEIKKKVDDQVNKAISALGFNNCAVNIDFIIKNDIPYVIELTGRAGANCLPELTSYYLGLNYYEMILINAIGQSPINYYNNRKDGAKFALSRQLFSNESGTIEDIICFKDGAIKLVDLFVSKGDKVKKFTDSRDCIGKALCVGSSLEECNTIMDNFVKNELIINVLNK